LLVSRPGVTVYAGSAKGPVLESLSGHNFWPVTVYETESAWCCSLFGQLYLQTQIDAWCLSHIFLSNVFVVLWFSTFYHLLTKNGSVLI